MSDALDELESLDPLGYFGSPVDEELIPEYRSVIPDPIDFGTMRARLYRGDYTHSSQLVDDFALLCRNALVFNTKADNPFRVAATALHRRGQLVLRAAFDSNLGSLDGVSGAGGGGEGGAYTEAEAGPAGSCSGGVGGGPWSAAGPSEEQAAASSCAMDVDWPLQVVGGASMPSGARAGGNGVGISFTATSFGASDVDMLTVSGGDHAHGGGAGGGEEEHTLAAGAEAMVEQEEEEEETGVYGLRRRKPSSARGVTEVSATRGRGGAAGHAAGAALALPGPATSEKRGAPKARVCTLLPEPPGNVGDNDKAAGGGDSGASIPLANGTAAGPGGSAAAGCAARGESSSYDVVKAPLEACGRCEPGAAGGVGSTAWQVARSLPSACARCGSGGEGKYELLRCICCGESFHPFCLGLAPGVQIDPLTWSCADCTFCSACHGGHDEPNLLLCDCGQAFHTYCLTPPVKAVPAGEWRCPKCVGAVTCERCGTAKPGRTGWKMGYRFCEKCYKMHLDKDYCPVCMHDWRDEGGEMVGCEGCG
jgi:hypothetical protein